MPKSQVTLGTIMWVYVGRNSVGGFAVFGVFWSELHINITMAVATRAPIVRKVANTSKDQGFVIPHHKTDHLISGRGTSGCFVARCVSCCRGREGGRKPTAKSFSVVRSDGFLLFQELAHQPTAANRFHIWLSFIVTRLPGAGPPGSPQKMCTITNLNVSCIISYFNIK